MPYPTSFWTGKLSISESVPAGVLTCTIEGDLKLEISLGPPLQGQVLAGSAAIAAELASHGLATIDTVAGTIVGTYNSKVISGDETTVGSGKDAG